MKKALLLILVVLLNIHWLFSQDIIIPQNGDNIRAKNVQIYKDSITYFDFDIPDGPQKVISIPDIYMIQFENGNSVTFSSKLNDSKWRLPEFIRPRKDYKGNYYMIGQMLGATDNYMYSLFQIQARFGGKQGLGIHFGYGFISNLFGSVPVFCTGVKFYPYKDFYINGQVMSFGYKLSNLYDSSPKIGYSLLAGFNFYWGKKVDIGVTPEIGFMYNPYFISPGKYLKTIQCTVFLKL
jgi:hypothetical protein